jgi:zinc protease
MVLAYAVVVVAVVFGVYGLKKAASNRALNPSLAEIPAKRIELPDGAVLLLKQVPGSQVVSLRCLIKTGSTTEGRWMGTGISHVVEHMLFKGTDRYGMADISTVLRDLGGQHNAYTSFERTVFYVTVPGQNAGPAMSVLANAVLHSTFPADELAKEQEVVYNEILMNQDRVERFFSDFMFRSFYDVHPYRLPVIGYAPLMKALTRDDVVAYHQEKYRPSNLIFAVAGSFDEAAVIRSVQAELATFHEVPIDPVVTEPEPVKMGGRYREARRPDAELTRLALVWPGVELRNSDMAALDLLCLMLGQGRPSLLYKTIKQEQGLVQEIEAYSYSPMQPGIIAVESRFEDAKFSEVTNAIFKVLRNADRNLSRKDLKRAKNVLLANRVFGLQTVDGITSGLVDGEYMAGNPDFDAAYAEMIRRTTLADIRGLIGRYLRRDICTIVAVRPPLKDGITAARTAQTNTRVRIERKMLRSGLRIVYVDRPELPLVNLKFIVKGGLLLDEQPGLNRFVNDALSGGSRGYPGLTADEEIEKAGGSISYFAGNNSCGATVASLSEYLPLAARILYQTVRYPLFPRDKVALVREDLLAEARSRREDLFQEGMDLLKQLFFTNHPYRYPASGTIASISNLSIRDLKRFHKANYTADNSVLVVTGRLSARDRRIVERIFSGIPRGHHAVRKQPVNGRDLSQSASIRRSTDKSRSLLLMAWPLPPLTDDSRWTIEVMNSVLSGLGGRLFVKLRDIEHLGYSVGGFPQFLLDGGMFIFYVTTTADKLAQAERSVVRELDALAAQPPTKAETDGSRNDLMGERLMNEQAFDSISLEAGLAELFYGDAKRYYTWPDRIAAVDPAAIRSEAARLFGNNARIVSLRGTK